MNRYALIGYPLGHSLSEAYFTGKFLKEGIRDAEYSLIEMPLASSFSKMILEDREILGVNVTIPLKSEIIPFLDVLDPVAEKIGAVNCIRIQRPSNIPKTLGFNTDHAAFRDTLKPLLKPWHNSAIILGTGGSARAVAYALNKLGLAYKYISRNPVGEQLGYGEITRFLLQEHPLIVNATPVGMFPHSTDMPVLPYEVLDENNLLYDLVYNPEITRFLQEGAKQGAAIKNGLEMLYLQAEYSWKIWNTSANSLFL